MTTVPMDRLAGAVSVPPSRLQPGDTIASTTTYRSLVVEQVEPIEISYFGRPVAVWWIKGSDDAPQPRARHSVILVCVPRKQWYLLRRNDA